MHLFIFKTQINLFLIISLEMSVPRLKVNLLKNRVCQASMVELPFTIFDMFCACELHVYIIIKP